MKKITISIMLLLTLLISTFSTITTNVFAADTGDALFSVEPILPDNQDALIKNYISITTNDGVKQTFQFNVRNRTDEEVTLKVRGFDTLTSSYGVLQYKVHDPKTDLMSLTDEKYYLSQYVEKEKEIILAPKENKVVDVSVDIPALEGSILGGIAFTAFVEGDIQKEEEVQFKINNEMNTIIGLMVNHEGPTKESLTYGEPWIQSMPSYYGIFLPTTHDIALLGKQGALEYEVFDKNGEKLFESKGTTLDFAPKSKTNLLFKWNSEKIKMKEEYRLKGKITFDKEVFPFDFPVILEDDSYIVPEEMQKIETKLEDEKDMTMIYIIGGAILFLLILALLLLLRKTKHVLLSNEQQASAVINKTDSNFTTVLKEKEAKKDKTHVYHHYYKATKNKTTKEVEYVFVETKIVNPNNITKE